MDEDEDSWEGYGDAYFSGECTCDHDEEDHGWGRCGVDNCECEAGYEE